MAIKFANNAYATLAGSITSSATSITLTTGEGARFPAASSPDYFYATLLDSANNLEIVKVTNRSTDVLTVVRAQESTTARAYAIADRIELRITAAALEAISEATLAGDGLDISGSTLSLDLKSSGGLAIDTTELKLDTANAQEWTGQQNFNATTLTYDATQDWNLAANQVCKLTLTANTTFDAPTNQVDGSVYVITIIQDGTGSRTAGWNTVFKFAGATVPTLTTTASAKDVFTFISDGTNMLCIAQVLNVS
jgi:hypothetical protein